MGAGKSTIGRHLADMLKMEFFDTDREIEARCGANLDWIFDIEGEEGFRERESKLIFELSDMQGIVLATGGSAVMMNENRARLAARGTVVYLAASLEQQFKRTQRDKRRPQLQVDDREGELKKLYDELTPLYEEIADITIETGEASVRTVANNIIQLLNPEKE
jgi:shikimate kinase